jgi:membrane protein YdbS with pleckstrin-like domain
VTDQKNAWEQSYGIRMFVAFLVSTIVMGVVKAFVSISLWLSILGAGLVYTAIWAIVVFH